MSSAKQRAAEYALRYIQDGMKVGLGTGSTAKFFIEALGKKVSEGLRIEAIATSQASENLALSLSIPMTTFAKVELLDVTVDGADEVEKSHLTLIKGGGGALLREKIVASSSKHVVIIVDQQKVVEQLGAFHLPVEIIPTFWETTKRRIEGLGCQAVLRSKEGKVFTSDNGNYIVDCDFGLIAEPQELEQKLQVLPGVVETGFFIDIVDVVVVGGEQGVTTLEKSAL